MLMCGADFKQRLNQSSGMRWLRKSTPRQTSVGFRIETCGYTLAGTANASEQRSFLRTLVRIQIYSFHTFLPAAAASDLR